MSEEFKNLTLTLPAPLVDWLQRNASETGKPVHVLAAVLLSMALGALDWGSAHYAGPTAGPVLCFDDGSFRHVPEMTPADRAAAVAGLREMAKGLHVFADAIENLPGATGINTA